MPPVPGGNFRLQLLLRHCLVGREQRIDARTELIVSQQPAIMLRETAQQRKPLLLRQALRLKHAHHALKHMPVIFRNAYSSSIAHPLKSKNKSVTVSNRSDEKPIQIVIFGC